MAKRRIIGSGFGQKKKAGTPTPKKVVIQQLEARFRRLAGPVLSHFGITDTTGKFQQVRLYDGVGAPMQTREEAQAFCTIGLQSGMLSNESGEGFNFTERYFRSRQQSQEAPQSVKSDATVSREDVHRYEDFLDSLYIFIALPKSARQMYDVSFCFDDVREWIRGSNGPQVSRNWMDRALEHGVRVGRLTKTATGHQFVARRVSNALHVALSKARKDIVVGSATQTPSKSTKVTTNAQTLSERELDILWSALLIANGNAVRVTTIHSKLRDKYARFEVAAPDASQQEVRLAFDAGVKQGWFIKQWPGVANSEVEYHWVKSAVDPEFYQNLESARAPLVTDPQISWLREHTATDGLRMSHLRKLIEENPDGTPFWGVQHLTKKIQDLVADGTLRAEGNTKARRYLWACSAAVAESPQTPAPPPAPATLEEAMRENVVLREQLAVERENGALLRQVVQHLMASKTAARNDTDDLLAGLPADMAVRARQIFDPSINN